jgi:hypothetical protein
MSDSDRQFVVSMATGLGNNKDANLRLLDIYERAHNRALELDKARQSATSGNGGYLTPAWLDHKTGLASKWAEEDRAREASESARTQQAPQKPASLPKGVTSIKRIN